MEEGKKILGGMYCLYKDCHNSFYNCEKGIKFFRFPRQIERCQIWLIHCGHSIKRTSDFLDRDISKFYSNSRVSRRHFEDYMFNNPGEKTRLLDTAIPINYTEIVHKGEEYQLDMQSTSKIRLNVVVEPAEKINIIEHVVIHPLSNAAAEFVQPPLRYSLGVQTPMSFFRYSPRKQKLKGKIEDMQSKNNKLRGEEMDAALAVKSSESIGF